MSIFNDLQTRIESAPKHELAKLEEEARKAYSGLKKDEWGRPLLDQTHYEILLGEIERRME